MKTCEEYQIDLSAMLDGELKPVEIADTVKHLTECDECRRVFAKFQTLQSMIEEESAVPAAPMRLWREIEREAGLPRKKEKSSKVISFKRAALRAVSLAAGIFIAFAGGYLLGKPGVQVPMMNDDNAPIIMASERGSMTDERFLQLTRELLSAEPAYHQKMYFILNTLNREMLEGSYDPPAVDDNNDDRIKLVRSSGNGDIVKY